MRRQPSIPHRSNVRLLGFIALLLFALNVLVAMNQLGGWERTCTRSAVSPIDMLPETPETVEYNRELRLRAAQRPETDEALRTRLGLQEMDDATVPIMQ